MESFFNFQLHNIISTSRMFRLISTVLFASLGFLNALPQPNNVPQYDPGLCQYSDQYVNGIQCSGPNCQTKSKQCIRFSDKSQSYLMTSSGKGMASAKFNGGAVYCPTNTIVTKLVADADSIDIGCSFVTTSRKVLMSWKNRADEGCGWSGVISQQSGARCPNTFALRGLQCVGANCSSFKMFCCPHD